MMPTISKITETVWKLSVDSNVYYIDGPEKIVIDTGPRSQGNMLETFLAKVVPLDKVERVFLTHLHYDHIGNYDKFPNATLHASELEIRSLFKDAKGTILDSFMAGKFKVDLKPFPVLDWLKVIPTPGHTVGSVCFFMPEEGILFSGDTLFANTHGRTDLPTSVPQKMQESLINLIQYNHKILCPGHD